MLGFFVILFLRLRNLFRAIQGILGASPGLFPRRFTGRWRWIAVASAEADTFVFTIVGVHDRVRQFIRVTRDLKENAGELLVWDYTLQLIDTFGNGLGQAFQIAGFGELAELVAGDADRKGRAVTVGVGERFDFWHIRRQRF